ncbi:MAG: hypothetical protein ACE5JE_04120 [Thermoplasmata archaeon]
MRIRTPVDERITLHVLRHPPSAGEAAEDAREVERPRGALREALGRADQEYRSVLREVKPVFYYGNATPTVMRIPRPTADRLRSSLRLRETVHGVWGPETVQHGDALYELWIQHQLCG